MTANTELAEIFEQQRPRLLAVARRVLGSPSDAEDAVQEAWLRLSRQDAVEIENLAGWLTTVVGRICIDILRSRTSRPEVAFEAGIPELVVTADVETPEESAVQADSVGLALLIVLGSLRPEERLAFVLHDMFAVPFAEIGQILDKSTDAVKMLASRARRKVQDLPPPSTDRRRYEQRRVVDAFLAAARDGDFDALLRVLDPDIRWQRYTARGLTAGTGPAEIVDAARRGHRSRVVARRVLVNGEPGILAWGPSGRPVGVMACTVSNGRMVGIVSIVDPVRLAQLSLPPGLSAGDD
ncbi:RNA polymerase sigma factor SigJ-like protein [Mycolicibacterium canariasense]|uniref:RNA polymerase sigma factor SigJ-like protein n=1 Tax=Mycolicibacterium canariasense TaxID=228230 RepID=A0A100WKU8_MYCCR|nr:sigma-70 family RNA polymerase sigma factor [Mycolicibacterium canariasense]MCV7207660.1 sigma-70 family RNA polymerase sigma factor [Mycolicibacterium canariasense]ORV08875.1 RNA polymerase subunit sigma-70 [Mycolicibacterium canariasense]GAS99774.1 RNA polymerase sigma factor SigJ-like protein [Mycolicibacterium canariasense]